LTWVFVFVRLAFTSLPSTSVNFENFHKFNFLPSWILFSWSSICSTQFKKLIKCKVWSRKYQSFQNMRKYSKKKFNQKTRTRIYKHFHFILKNIPLYSIMIRIRLWNWEFKFYELKNLLQIFRGKLKNCNCYLQMQIEIFFLILVLITIIFYIQIPKQFSLHWVSLVLLFFLLIFFSIQIQTNISCFGLKKPC